MKKIMEATVDQIEIVVIHVSWVHQRQDYVNYCKACLIFVLLFFQKTNIVLVINIQR